MTNTTKTTKTDSPAIERTPQQIRNIKRWVKSLRSGKYRQGTGALCTSSDNGDKYCCLGVAANELISGTWEKRDYDEWELVSTDGAIRYEATILPQAVLDELFGPGLIVDQLTALNDCDEWSEVIMDQQDRIETSVVHPARKMSFRGIAQHIERVTGVRA